MINEIQFVLALFAPHLLYRDTCPSTHQGASSHRSPRASHLFTPVSLGADYDRFNLPLERRTTRFTRAGSGPRCPIPPEPCAQESLYVAAD